MKVILDTNVWRRINADYSALKKRLIAARAEVFLVETVFTLEAVQKQSKNGVLGRLEFFQKISKNDFSLNPYLSKAIQDTQELRIKILRTPRIGMPFNIDLPSDLFYKDTDVHERMERMGYITREFPNAGYEGFKRYIRNLNIQEPWQTHLSEIPISEANNFANAVAEWADGDTVSACYGYGIDKLCTADNAKNAGEDSIFSAENRKILEENHGLSIVSPIDLTAIL